MFRTLIVSYLSNLFAAIAGIICVPLYYRVLDTQDFVYVSYFFLFFPLLTFLDLGIGSTVLRQTSLYRAKAVSELAFRELLAGLQLVSVALIVVAFVLAISYWTFFLPGLTAGPTTAVFAFNDVPLYLLASFLLRWISNMYRSCISGMEQLQWLSWFNILTTTLRYFVAIGFLSLVGYSAFHFFIFQCLISFFELVSVYFKAKQGVPLGFARVDFGSAIYRVREVLKFSSTLGVGAAIWVVAAQMDKVYLAHLLTAFDYGIFSMAVLLAAGVSTIAAPINYVLLPRLSMLHAGEDMEGYLKTYRRMTQFLVVTAGSVAAVFMFFGAEAFWVWTGKQQDFVSVVPVLGLYAVGNFFLSLSIFGHYAQISIGNLRYYLRAIGIFSVGLIILLLLFTRNDPVLGAGYAWASINALYLFGWTSFVHRRLVPALALNWIARDITVTFVCMIALNAALNYFMPVATSRLEAFILLGVASALSAILAAMLSPFIRFEVLKQIRSRS
jgi:O-antigen/teichoic acid export membrane protein